MSIYNFWASILMNGFILVFIFEIRNIKIFLDISMIFIKNFGGFLSFDGIVVFFGLIMTDDKFLINYVHI